MNDEEAPVSIRNFKGLPKGEDIFMYGKVCPCLFKSRYPVGPGRHLVENFDYHQLCY